MGEGASVVVVVVSWEGVEGGEEEESGQRALVRTKLVVAKSCAVSAIRNCELESTSIALLADRDHSLQKLPTRAPPK